MYTYDELCSANLMKRKLSRNVNQRLTVLYSYLDDWHIIPDNRKPIGKYTISPWLW